MGKLPTHFEADLLQLVNVCLHENAERHAGEVSWRGVPIYVHSPKPENFEVRMMDGPVATFSLSPLPGCCGVLVSYYSEVRADQRKLGLGTILLKTRMDAARRGGYGHLIATVLASNKVEEHLLQDNGWVCTGEFRNPKTSNLVHIWQVNL